MVAEGEDEQSVEDVERPKPTRVELRVGEERLQKHEQEQRRRQAENCAPHAADDRRDEHQDRYEVEDDEAPLPVRLQAFAAQYAEAARRNWIATARTNDQASPTKTLRATSIRVLPSLFLARSARGIAGPSELIVDP